MSLNTVNVASHVQFIWHVLQQCVLWVTNHDQFTVCQLQQ